MSLLSALDRFVHVTRLDILTPYAHRRPRSLRWLPLAVLFALPAGFALQVAAARMAGWPWQAGFAGSLLFVLALVGAWCLPFFGPRLRPDAAHPLDERELLLKARANAIAGAILSTLVMLGCFYGAWAAVFGRWMPTAAIEWVFLGLGIQAYAAALPVLVASWLEPVLDDEE